MTQERSLAEIREMYPGLSVRETIVEVLRDAGLDFFTAHEYAGTALSEFKASPLTTLTFYVGKTSFTLQKN